MTWLMLLRRPTLSVLDRVYEVQTASSSTPITLDEQVIIELTAAANLMPLMYAEPRRKWWEQLFMTDAAPTGGALVIADATVEEVIA